MGPRAARVHFGSGQPGFSAGAGPVGFYTSLGGRRFGPGGRSGSPSAAGYQRQVVAQQQYLTMVEKEQRRREVAKAFLHILNLHRVEFPPARPPVAAPPSQPDRAAIYRHYEQHALAGLGAFKRRARNEAKQRASAQTESEAQRQWVEASEKQAQLQAYYDERWRQLYANVPDVVMETLEVAFEDNEAPSAAVGVDGDEVALVVLVPGADMAVPDQMPGTTAAGNPSLKKITQREREDFYKVFVCGQVLVTVREAFAVAPGLGSARVVVLRRDGSDVYGREKTSCILAVKLDRAALERVQWETADAAQIVNEVSSDLLIDQRGRSRGLSPIDLAGETELAKLIEAVDLTELVDDDAEHAAPGLLPSGAPAALPVGAVAPVQVGPLRTYVQGSPRVPSGVASWFSKPINKVLAILVGIPVVLCGAIGVVGAIGAMAGNGDGNPVPGNTRSSSSFYDGPVGPVAPYDGSSASVPTATGAPASSSSGDDPPTLPPPPPPPDNDPPAPPPPPDPPATQKGVHPGAFCSPKWAFGLTSAGTLMQCKPSATDTRFRWRRA